MSACGGGPKVVPHEVEIKRQKNITVLIIKRCDNALVLILTKGILPYHTSFRRLILGFT